MGEFRPIDEVLEAAEASWSREAEMPTSIERLEELLDRRAEQARAAALAPSSTCLVDGCHVDVGSRFEAHLAAAHEDLAFAARIDLLVDWLRAHPEVRLR
jgi:hypothetical protein